MHRRTAVASANGTAIGAIGAVAAGIEIEDRADTEKWAVFGPDRPGPYTERLAQTDIIDIASVLWRALCQCILRVPAPLPFSSLLPVCSAARPQVSSRPRHKRAATS